MVGYENQGTAYDPLALGYEMQGRRSAERKPAQSIRELAEQAMQRFADAGGFPLDMREEARGDLVCFIGTAPDGREYAIGYRPEA